MSHFLPRNFLRPLGWVPVVMIAGLTLAEPHKVRVSDPALARSLMAKGATLVADYGGFQVLESDLVPAGGTETALAERADRFNLIQLAARQLDTRKPEVQSLRKPAGHFSGKRLHLVQFAGPVKPEWIAALKEQGVQIVNYVPANAYLVYGDATALGRLQDWARSTAWVQWDGDYAQEYRIHPRALRTSSKGRLRNPAGDRYAVQLLEDADANPATLALIDRLRLAPVDRISRVLHFLNVIVRLPGEQLSLVAARPDVVFIQPYLLPQKMDERQDQIVAGNLSAGVPSGPGYLAWLSNKGFSRAQFDASGFVVDVSDSGIDNGTNAPGHFGLYSLGNPALASRVMYNRLEGYHDSGSTLQGCDGHGTLNAHIIAGYCGFSGFPFADSAGFDYGLGVCPFVRIGSSVIFDPDDFTYPDYPNLQSKAYHDGARISANSWGNAGASGNYDTDAQAYDALVRDAQPGGSTYATSGNQEMVIVFSAGNNGPTPQTISSPGSAKNIITVGAAENVRSLSMSNGGADSAGDTSCTNSWTDDSDAAADNANDLRDSSSRGPCWDGRMKPDLVAPGSHITGGVPQNGAPATNATGSALACFDASQVCALPGKGGTGNPFNFFPLSQQFYTVSSGTSHSAPAVAGACALLRQYFINHSLTPPSPAMTKAYLMNAARYLDGAGANDTLWSTGQGMGELNLGTAFDGVPRVLSDEVPAAKLTGTGQTRVFTGAISDPSKPVRVTLAWTDAPGNPGSGKALVNDLDLTVTLGGATYKGNVFGGAYSTTGGTADSLNNVESVFLPAGHSNNFVATITAANIAADGVNNGGSVLEQDYALVVYNAIETWVPVIALNSAAITAENCSPTNGAIDPGETVTVAFGLRNVGSGNTANLVATLLQTNGVALPGGPRTYGALVAGGSSVTQAFSFTAGGICQGSIQPVLQLQDGSTNLGTVSMSLDLGATVIATTEVSNTGMILIPGSGTEGPASPYPSTIAISGLTGIVSHVAVTLAGLTHEFVADVDALLVGPSGTNVLLMSYCGGDLGGEDMTLTFDDDADSQLPENGQITSGTYQPTPIYGTYEVFPAPAPNSPFGQTLSVFNGLDPNGTWSLYLYDNFEDGTGYLARGWQLDITTSNRVCCTGMSLPAPQIQSFSVSNGIATVTWSAIPYQTYRLQFSTHLHASGWSNILPDVIATGFTATNTATNSTAQCFYRVLAVH